MFSRFTRGGMVWADGREEAVNSVVLATWYRPELGYLETLGALREDGRPDQRAGVSRAAERLYFVGLFFQTSFASATLRGAYPDAALVVSRLRGHLSRDPRADA
jgi:putative flavoprotein involved in K+ transport